MSLNLADYKAWKIRDESVDKLTVGGAVFWSAVTFDGIMLGGDKNVSEFKFESTAYNWVTNYDSNVPYGKFVGGHRMLPSGEYNNLEDIWEGNTQIGVRLKDSFMRFAYAGGNADYAYLPTYFLSKSIRLNDIESISFDYQDYGYGAGAGNGTISVYLIPASGSAPIDISDVSFSYGQDVYRGGISSNTVSTLTINTSGMSGYYYLAITNQDWSNIGTFTLEIPKIYAVLRETSTGGGGIDPMAYVASNAADAPTYTLPNSFYSILQLPSDESWNKSDVQSKIESAIERKAWDEINMGDDRTYLYLFGITYIPQKNDYCPTICHYFNDGDKKWMYRKAFRCTCNGAYCDGYNGKRGISPRLALCLRDILNYLREHVNSNVMLAVNSGIRCPTTNGSTAGSSDTSHHLVGQAVDVCVTIGNYPTVGFGGLASATESTNVLSNAVYANIEHWNADYGCTCVPTGDLHQEANGSWFTHFSIRDYS